MLSTFALRLRAICQAHKLLTHPVLEPGYLLVPIKPDEL